MHKSKVHPHNFLFLLPASAQLPADWPPREPRKGVPLKKQREGAARRGKLIKAARRIEAADAAKTRRPRDIKAEYTFPSR